MCIHSARIETVEDSGIDDDGADGMAPHFEGETAEGFSLDVAQPEFKLGIEVDWPSHYLKAVSSGENVVNGTTRFKTRQLRSFGWTVTPSLTSLSWTGTTGPGRRG